MGGIPCGRGVPCSSQILPSNIKINFCIKKLRITHHSNVGDRYIALVGVLQYWGYFLSHLARMGVGTGEGVSEGASSMQGEACEDTSSSSMLGEGALSMLGEDA